MLTFPPGFLCAEPLKYLKILAAVHVFVHWFTQRIMQRTIPPNSYRKDANCRSGPADSNLCLDGVKMALVICTLNSGFKHSGMLDNCANLL